MSLDELKHVPGLAHSKLERHGLHFLHVVLRAVADHRGEAQPPPPEGFVDNAAEHHSEPLPSQGGGAAWGGPAPLQGFAPRASTGGAAAAAQAAAQAAAAARAAAAAEALDGVDLEALDDDDFVPPPPKAQRIDGGADPEAQQQPGEQRRASAAEEWAADGGEDWDGGWDT
jgi:hypothetical protein